MIRAREDLPFALGRSAMLARELAGALAAHELAAAEVRRLAAEPGADLVQLAAAGGRAALAAGRLAGFASLVAQDRAGT